MQTATPAPTGGSPERRGLKSQAGGLRFSIVICTHNRADLLQECLEAAFSEMRANDAFGEILVIDNASSDRTREVVETFARRTNGDRVAYLFEPKPNLCIARNRGIEEANGKIIIFLDDDAIVESGWLAACLGAFDGFPDAVAAGGEILPRLTVPPPAWFQSPLTHIYTVISLEGTTVRPFPHGGHPLGANMAFRREAFLERRFSERLGRSGSRLMTGDEAEICASIRREGGTILYVPEMKVRHHIHPERLTESWAKERYYFEGVSQASMRLGWRSRLKTSCAMGAKFIFFVATLPFLSSHSRQLLWTCRIQKSVGYFAQLLGLADRRSG